MSDRNKCLVFGANGYIGRHLVKFLKEGGLSVKATDIQDRFVSADVDYFKTDITDVLNLKGIDWDIDYVFMFAGITGTTRSFENYNKYIKINEVGLLNVLNEIQKSDFRPRIVFPSTRLVYKGSRTPLREEDPKETKTIYAVNKIACENILKAYSGSFNIPYTIYRICVPYDDHFEAEYSYGTIGFFLNQAKNKGTINLFGDGSLRRTFTSIEDVCMQIINTCQNEKSVNQVYNIMGEEFSLKEIATLIADKYKSNITFSAWPEEHLRIESGDTVFNSEKIESEFNLSLLNSFESWLAKI